MATRKKQKGAAEDVLVAPVATPAEAGAEKPAPKRKPAARKAAAKAEPVTAVHVTAPQVAAPVEPVAAPVEPVVEPAPVAPRPTRQQIAARAFWHFQKGSRDTLGNWLRAEREMADVVARGLPNPTDRWMQALAGRSPEL